MNRKIFFVFSVVTVLMSVIQSCNEPAPPVPEEPVVEAPAVTLEVNSIDRTSVSFTLKSDAPGDFAWAILPASESVGSAEDLFKKGTVGMFGSANVATVDCTDLEGGNSYVIYAAVRKINPYVYSELVAEEISTDFAYEDMITLEKVTSSEVSYHIEMPEDAKAYRHMIVDYNDFLYFQALVGVTHDSYLSAFGLGGKESKTYEYEWVQWDGWDNYATYFYSDTKYLILAGKSESTEIDSQVSASDVKYIEFTTPKAEKCPYELAVDVSDITSLTATVTLIPEEGVDRYRTVVMSEDDYNSFLFEGEEMVRRAVIGPWDDYSTEYKGAVTLPLSGLMPETNYYVCAVVFDDEMRELYVEKMFTTSEPSGPAPEIMVETMEVEEPWNSAKVNLKLKNTVSAVSFVHTKSAVDEVLNMPGNEDLTMDVVIRNNGTSLSADVLSKASSESGCELLFSNLSPNVDYVFAIMATNSEYVSTVYVYDFKTGAEPVVETTLIEKLKGEYTAVITDLDGKTHSFDVTIADGVNDATREAYAAENILVCLGFDACGIKYNSPEDLLKKGWAKNEEEANRNYGPKWFLEVDKDDKITTYKHAVSSRNWDEVNKVEIVEYSAEGEAPMASFNGTTIWFKGTFWRDFSSPNREDQAMATTLVHDVDYDSESGVITVNPVTHYKSWSAKGQMITEYPGVEKGKSWSTSSSEVIFCGNSALVLTPKQKSAKSASILPLEGRLVKPAVKEINVQENRPVIKRKMIL